VGTWEWDPSLYAGSAPYYLAGRVPYSPQLPAVIRKALGLDGHGRLLDVGTGPGVIALDLAPLFQQVVGIDADRGMVEEAKKESLRRGCTNAEWHQLRAEELPAGLGTFRLISFGQSFHWMKREEVADAVRGMLDPDRGRLALISMWSVRGIETDRILPHPSPPNDAIAALVQRYLGSVRRAGRGSLPEGTPSDEEIVLGRSGFSLEQTLAVSDERVITWTVEQVVASVFSLSRSAPHLFGDHLEAFEGELRALLDAASPDGHFSLLAGDDEVRIFSPAEPA
jgi:SAM-dependent methyltransferase